MSADSVAMSNLLHSPDPEISFKSKNHSGNRADSFENLKGDPAFGKFIKKLVAKEMKDNDDKRRKTVTDRAGKSPLQ